MEVWAYGGFSYLGSCSNAIEERALLNPFIWFPAVFFPSVQKEKKGQYFVLFLFFLILSYYFLKKRVPINGITPMLSTL